MKKISVLVLILFAAVGAFAQEKTIERTEFDKLFQPSITWIKNQTHRETEISESTAEMLPQSNVPVSVVANLSPIHTSYKVITEYLPRVGYHSIYEFNSTTLHKRNEKIRIADKLYSREGNGVWTEETLSHPAPYVSKTKIVDYNIEFKFIGTENFNNQNASVYTAIEQSKIISLTNNTEVSSAKTTKYWFAEDGKLLKTESKTDIRGDKSITHFNSTKTYELDPNIKIEAPNLTTTK